MKILKSVAIYLAILVVFGGAMFGLNLYTAPIIEANNAGAELAPLLEVMPEGSKFDGNSLIYDSANPSAYTLQDVGENVTKIYKEADGKGFAIRCQATSDYSSAPMVLTIGVDAEGKICGLQINEYHESYDVQQKAPNYLPSYIGQDSALADVDVNTGATFSATAIKNAVSEGLNALISNNMIQAGVKSDAQILTEMIPEKFPAMVSGGALKATEVTVSGNITLGYKANNATGFAYIVAEGEASYLAIVNATGVCKVYNVEGADVTAEKSAIVAEATAHATANQTAHAEKANKKFARMMGATYEEVTFEAVAVNTFNTVVYASTFTVAEQTYYGFYSRSIGFEQMEVFIVLDANGAIAKLDATAFFFETDYFYVGGKPIGEHVNITDYKNGFIGLNGETFTGENAMITGATMTSNAVKLSTNDAFATFQAVNNGGNQE